jgi:hypothetical protein
MERNSFALGQRIRLTDAGHATAVEYSPDDVPATREATVTHATPVLFSCLFDDGTLWEDTSAGGGDEPVYFEALSD